LEFLRDGYSKEASGRAVFFNDHVIVGAASDPAGVMAVAEHDAARAFELIAAAGAAGRANFVSRADEDGSNFAERDVWDKTNVPRNARSEPGSGAAENPPWYRRANSGAATTAELADKCEYPGGGCYALIDRGSFTRLVRNGTLKNLKIVTQRNDDDVPGGAGLLVNPYHAYAVDEEKVDGVDAAGAKAFLDFMTSREFQDEVEEFPDTDNDQDPFFFPSAFPEWNLATPSNARLPRKLRADQTQTITGRITHMQPVFGPLRDIDLTINRVAGEDDFIQLGTDNTGPNGEYRLKFRPTRSDEYRLIFPGAFDLQPAFRNLGHVRLRAVVNLTSARARAGGVRLRGKAYPDRDRADARLVIQGRRGGSGRFRRVAIRDLSDSGRSFVTTVKLDAGQWDLRVRYEDRGAVDAGTSQPRSVSVR
jgi:tungstate transport system substrate-binding protein